MIKALEGLCSPLQSWMVELGFARNCRRTKGPELPLLGQNTVVTGWRSSYVAWWPKLSMIP